MAPPGSAAEAAHKAAAAVEGEGEGEGAGAEGGGAGRARLVVVTREGAGYALAAAAPGAAGAAALARLAGSALMHHLRSTRHPLGPPAGWAGPGSEVGAALAHAARTGASRGRGGGGGAWGAREGEAPESPASFVAGPAGAGLFQVPEVVLEDAIRASDAAEASCFTRVPAAPHAPVRTRAPVPCSAAAHARGGGAPRPAA